MRPARPAKEVKAALRGRFATGAHYGAMPHAGYVKDRIRKAIFLIDPETRCDYRLKIFALAVHGPGSAALHGFWSRRKYLLPGGLNFQRYGTYRKYLCRSAEERSLCVDDSAGEKYSEKRKPISDTAVHIADQLFIQKQEENASQKRMVSCGEHPRSDYFRRCVPSSTRADLQQAQTQKNGTTQIFSGLVKCADCGWSLPML